MEEGERASCLLLQGLWHDKQQKSVYLLFDRSFLAKTQRIHHRVQTALNIPVLPYDEQEERYLCPIRYLTSSLDRTKEIRKKGTLIKLFIPYRRLFQGDIGDYHLFLTPSI